MTNLLLNTDRTFYRQKLSCRQVVCEPVPNNRITCASDAYEIAWKNWDPDEIGYVEHGYALYLNRANMPVCWALIGIGGVSGTMMDPKVIMAHALLCGASSILLFHNHPSGSLQCSEADRQLTQKVKNACKVMDMALLDHVIMSPHYGRYLSMADESEL